MAELDLPAGPAEILEAVRIHLGHHLGGERELRLGGGTALAARWQHRHSTDMDFFVDASAFARLRKAEQQFRNDLRSSGTGCREITLALWHARIVLADGGEVSISTSRPVTLHPVSSDTVRGTDVALETTEEILAKKLNYRMMGNAQLVPRDLYDLAAARRLAPRALEAALSTLREGDLEEINTELGDLGPAWMQQHRQPLTRPANRHDAMNAVRIVRAVIQRHIRPRGPGRGRA